jgi:hypothetical protein
MKPIDDADRFELWKGYAVRGIGAIAGGRIYWCIESAES